MNKITLTFRNENPEIYFTESFDENTPLYEVEKIMLCEFNGRIYYEDSSVDFHINKRVKDIPKDKRDHIKVKPNNDGFYYRKEDGTIQKTFYSELYPSCFAVDDEISLRMLNYKITKDILKSKRIILVDKNLENHLYYDGHPAQIDINIGNSNMDTIEKKVYNALDIPYRYNDPNKFTFLVKIYDTNPSEDCVYFNPVVMGKKLRVDIVKSDNFPNIMLFMGSKGWKYYDHSDHIHYVDEFFDDFKDLYRETFKIMDDTTFSQFYRQWFMDALNLYYEKYDKIGDISIDFDGCFWDVFTEMMDEPNKQRIVYGDVDSIFVKMG